MSANKQQLISLLAQGASIDEVAEALGYEPEAVQTMVVVDSDIKFAVKSGTGSGPTLEDRFRALEDVALDTLETVMTQSLNDVARLKAASYVLDQRLGLKKLASNTTFNISDFNVQLAQARRVKEAVLEVEADVVMA